MFISQGPLGSLRAGKNMLSVFSDIYWIGTKLDFFPFFSNFISFTFREDSSTQCVRESVYACAHACAHVVHAYKVFQPCGHASGTST